MLGFSGTTETVLSTKNPITNAVEEAASEQLGIGRWDRPAIFQDAAGAATDADLPYWTVLVLSGGIATLGLATNSSAVVIGAMLIAPLLSPVVGLALALAVGDGRLALQTGIMVLVSTLAVVVTGALLTAVLPFQTITAEIAARTRPTTLDLAIAVFSGLAGAVVTVARGHRLSAAIPGVAISVALIPPLAVAGFGVGIGWNGELIRGSLLLYGANLAGIVLSGMAVFLLIGMHRENVIAAAADWHRDGGPTGLVRWVDQFEWVRSLGVLRNPATRIALVLAFVIATAVPLSETLDEIARERRVRSAVDSAAEAFLVPGRSSLLSEQVVIADDRTQVYLRVATTEWFGDTARANFERRASAVAGEPVRLVLEQLPASTGDIEQLSELIPNQGPRPVMPPPPPPPTRLPELVASVRTQLRQNLATLPLPGNVAVVGSQLSLNSGAGLLLRVGYAAADPLPPEAEQILARQLASTLRAENLQVRFDHVSTRPRVLGDSVVGSESLRDLATLLQQNERLQLQMTFGRSADSARSNAVLRTIRSLGVEPGRVVAQRDTGQGIRARVLPVETRPRASAPTTAGVRQAD